MARSWDGDGMIGGTGRSLTLAGRGTGRSLALAERGTATENNKTGNRVRKTFCFRGLSTKGDAFASPFVPQAKATNYGRGLAVRCSAGCDCCGAGDAVVLVPEDEPLDDEEPADEPVFRLYSRSLDEPFDEPCV